MKKIILASQSPRRRELLSRIIADFDVLVTQADENIDKSIPPEEYVTTLALRKAQAVDFSDAVVIGSDTVVVCDGEILGKPTDMDDAHKMLKKLSGRSHYVYTGVAVISDDIELTDYEKTEVVFDDLSEEKILGYIQSGEPMDKAGAYGIQGMGALFIRGICGDYNNVVGLPLFKLGQMLQKCGVRII